MRFLHTFSALALLALVCRSEILLISARQSLVNVGWWMTVFHEHLSGALAGGVRR